jgi:hypothetical protein
MQPSIFGIVILAIAVFLWRRPAGFMLALTLVCTLFGSTAAVVLTSAGHTNILLANFAILLLFLRSFTVEKGGFDRLACAFRENWVFAAFAIYGALTAFILPHLFDHGIYGAPMRPTSDRLLGAAPVAFSTQNVTTAIYLLGTMAAALASFSAARRERNWQLLVTVAVWMAWFHIGTGVADIVLSRIGHLELLNFFRNADYAQLDQYAEGVHRISGIESETSGYSATGLTLLIVNVELWLRGIMPKRSGIVALAMLAILMLTTSTTAYVGVAGYALLLGLRVVVTPMRLPVNKIISLLLLAALATAAIIGLLIFKPHVIDFVVDFLQQSTVHKVSSLSGRQRSFWAQSCWNAFLDSYGLGVGAGSLRSSGLIQAVAGATGIFGLMSLGWYVLTVLRLRRLSTHSTRLGPSAASASAAFAWAAFGTLLPAVISGPTPDPGLMFGIFAGISLGLAQANTRSAAASSRPSQAQLSS